MKLTNINFVLVLLVLLIIIGLFAYSFYHNFNYKIKEKFAFTPSNQDETEIFDKLTDYSNIIDATAPTIVSDIQSNINKILPDITSKKDYLEKIANTNSIDLKIIEYSLKNDIKRINKDMDGSIILPINKNIVENFNGTPQFPIPTSIKIFEKFADTTDWRNEWNEKLKNIYSTSSTTFSPKDMDPVVNKDNTEFYILKNLKLEENLNNTSSEIIKNNLDNISNKLKSQWLKNKF